MIHFRCPKCQVALAVADEHAGKATACGQCKAPLRIPNAPAPAAEPIAFDGAPPPGNRRRPGPDSEAEHDRGAREAEEVESPAERRKRLEKTNRLVRQVLWGLCAGWTGLCLLNHWSELPRAQSAVQEAASAAMACASMVAGYIITRCVDMLLRGDREAP